MMLRAFIVGAGSGYITKILQAACTAVLLPYLLLERNLGLTGFGEFSAIQALVAILILAFDGWRQSVGTTIGRQVAAGSMRKRDLGASIGWSFLGATGLALVAVLAVERILAVAGLNPSGEYKLVFMLLVGQMAVEQGLYPAVALLHAAKSTWRINVAVAVEVVLRTLAVFVWFSASSASISVYAVVILVSAVLRASWLAMRAFRQLEGGAPAAVDDVARGRDTFSYSLSLLGASAAEYMIFRMPVILMSRFVGAEAAAVVSVLLNSIPNYLRQITWSVLRPMVIPLGATIDFSVLSPKSGERFEALLRTYQFLGFFVCACLGATAWFWLNIWLGSEWDKYASLLNILVLAIGLQLATAFQYQLLVAQNRGGYLAFWGILLALGASAAMVAWVKVSDEPRGLLAVVVAYCVLFYGIAVNELFIRLRGGANRQSARRTAVALIGAVVGVAVIEYGAAAVLGPLRSAGMMAGIAVSSIEIALVAIAGFVLIAPGEILRHAWSLILAEIRRH